MSLRLKTPNRLISTISVWKRMVMTFLVQKANLQENPDAVYFAACLLSPTSEL